MIEGVGAAWLARRAEELNQRFDRAARRYPNLSGDALASLVTEVLPNLAGDEPEADTLLSSFWDLALLHLGRDTLASRPGLRVMLKETFPRIRALLLQRPSRLPQALSNAVENMAERGVDYAHALASIGERCTSADELLDAGAVLAWRLGEARLRVPALEIARRLRPRLALDALGMSDWPEDAAPFAIGALEVDAWRHPRSLFATPPSKGAPEAADLLERYRTRPTPPLSAWTLVHKIGDFSGFGGQFTEPPVVLDAGSRHELWAEAGGRTFRIHADHFGYVAVFEPALEAAHLEVRVPRGDTARLPLLAGATSYTELDGIIAFTRGDTHRIRILAPPASAI